MFLYRWASTRGAASALLTIAAASAFGSAANTAGFAFDQTVAAGAFDDSVRILGNQGNGSGGLFDIHNDVAYNGNLYHILCLATADHVTRQNSGYLVGFEGGVGPNAPGRFTINPTGLNSGVIAPRGNEDLDFFGVTVDYNSLTQAQNDYLDRLNGLTLGTGAAVNDNLVSYGYGLSAKYAANGANRVGFIWQNTYGGAYDFGVHRFVNQTVTSVQNGYNPGYNGGIYTFNTMRWKVNNAAGSGSIFPGDSGGVIMQGSSWVGINTDGVFDTDAAHTYWQSLYNYDQGGLRFNQGDVDWLHQQCEAYSAVPEPASVCIVGLGLAALLRRRKKA